MMMSSLMYKNKNKIYVSANENFNLNVIKSNISFRHARSQTSVNICPHGIKYRKMVAYSIGKSFRLKKKRAEQNSF